MLNPLVSIIVPCYNQAQYLAETLDSVLSQTYCDWECIIINDGSPDNTEEIAKLYSEKDKRFRYIFKENSGLSSTRNAGLRIVKGKYIQFLDADDLLQKEKIKLQVSFLEQNSEVDIVYSGSLYFLNSNLKETFVLGRAGMVPTINLDKDNTDQIYPFLWRNVTTICSTLYRRSVFKLVPGFDENLKSLEDWDFHFFCALNNIKFHFLKNSNDGVLIRLHSESMLTKNQRTIEAYNLLLKKMHSNLNKKDIDNYRKLGLPEALFPKHDSFKESEKLNLYTRLAIKMKGIFIR
jgi:glycosyltransferase involved in cell wall biosynthesis